VSKPDRPGVRVTVAVVSYNHQEYVAQCLQSLLDQTIRATIIVVDDHSTDNSQSVIRRFVEGSGQEDRFTLLMHRENTGLPAGLNEALGLVDTEYFVYLAADDWSLPDRLEKQVTALDNAGSGTGLCYTDCLRARPDGSFHPETFSQNHSESWIPETRDPYRDLLLFDNWIPAPTVMFRTAALRAIGGFDEHIAYEDHDSYVRMAREFALCWLPEPLSVHRELEGGLGEQLFYPDSPRWLDGVLRMELKQLGHRRDVDEQLAPQVRVRAIRLLKLGGDRVLVRRALARSWRIQPNGVGVAYWLLSLAPEPLVARLLPSRQRRTAHGSG